MRDNEAIKYQAETLRAIAFIFMTPLALVVKDLALGRDIPPVQQIAFCAVLFTFGLFCFLRTYAIIEETSINARFKK